MPFPVKQWLRLKRHCYSEDSNLASMRQMLTYSGIHTDSWVVGFFQNIIFLQVVSIYSPLSRSLTCLLKKTFNLLELVFVGPEDQVRLQSIYLISFSTGALTPILQQAPYGETPEQDSSHRFDYFNFHSHHSIPSSYGYSKKTILNAELTYRRSQL